VGCKGDVVADASLPMRLSRAFGLPKTGMGLPKTGVLVFTAGENTLIQE